ncbi:MAG TPA: helix-turn-helix domain-containing protein [Candidatus Polarisedimenticolia bacterium]|nr:helix-turn-helix domain-containing protein [Candidatus Polarisedimenticolia bacterium]
MIRTNKKIRYSPQSKQLPLADPSGPGKTCAPEAAEEMFRILEGRWKMAILFHLFGGIDKKCRVMRFSELERAIPAISQKMLIQQLRELERDGIVLRTIYPQIPPRVEYQLTKVGIALRPALRALLAWAALRKQAMAPSS